MIYYLLAFLLGLVSGAAAAGLYLMWLLGWSSENTRLLDYLSSERERVQENPDHR